MIPVISIITANFNSGSKLVRTYQSFVNEAVDWEYLIIDGCSNDQSIEIATRLSIEDGRVRLLSEADDGVYDAMNKGIALAKGRYVYFLGAGDELIAGSLDTLLNGCDSDGPAMLYGNVIFEDRIYDGAFNSRKMLFQNICHQAIVYTASVFNRCGRFNTKYRRLADWEFNLRCFGDDFVVKQFYPITIAHFETGGVSSEGDADFQTDRLFLIRKHLGWRLYLAAKWRLVKTVIRRLV